MKILAYDTETTGLNLHTGARMFAYSTCDPRGQVDVVRLDGPSARRVRGKQKLEKFWRNPSSAAIAMHDAKFDLTATEGYLGRPLSRERQIHCTLTLARLIRSNLRSYELEDLLWVLCGYPKGDGKLVRRLAATPVGLDYSKVPEDVMRQYQVGDAERCELLALSLVEQLRRDTPGVRDVYDWERRLIWTTMDIEKRGVYVRRHTAKRLLQRLEKKTEDALDKLEHLAGERLKAQGPQVARFLFGQLGMPVLRRTASGGPSADKDTLLELREKFKHPIIDAVLECRSYIGARAAIASYLELSEADGFIHPDINTCGAQTGRESISRPNLQNVRLAGRLDDPYPVPARVVFGPQPGCFNLHADYSGIEMRGLVHYSRDPVMTRAFQEGENPHVLGAEVWYGERWRNASPGERVALYLASKNGNFAYHYGAGLARMAAVLLLPIKEVAARLLDYQRRFPGAASLPKEIQELVMAQGYVTTAFGRRIFVPRAKPYIGTNYIVQGTTTGDIIKRAQVRVADYLHQQWGDSAGIILPIHDEIVISCDIKLLPRVKEIKRDVTAIMTDFPQLRVPLEVEWKISRRDWANLEEIH